jgi:GT2 family glycosyltransferase
MKLSDCPVHLTDEALPVFRPLDPSLSDPSPQAPAVLIYVDPASPPDWIEKTWKSLLAQTLPPAAISLFGYRCAVKTLSAAVALIPETIDTLLLLRAGPFCHPEALARGAAALAASSSPLLYADERKGGHGPDEGEIWFRPDWNPDLAHAQPYAGEAFFCRRDLLIWPGPLPRRSTLDIPGLAARTLFWDLFLQAAEAFPETPPDHLAQHLFWQTPAVSDSPSAPAQEAALLRRTARAQAGARARRTEAGSYRWDFPQTENADPLVSIIIPTRNYRKVLEPCVESILTKTKGVSFEIIIADNETNEADSLAYLDDLRRRGVRVVPCPGPFNFSRVNNTAAAEAKGTLLAFLNNDIEVVEADWLAEMAQHALRPDIGAVGARLLYPDGRIQHAGVICGVGHVAAHAFRFFPPDSPGVAGRLQALQNYTAVTAACLVIRREIFERVGGYDVENLAISNNDVDFCLRVREAGFWNLYTPHAVLLHHESASRGGEYDSPEKKQRYGAEVRYMKKRWREWLQRDPAYNPGLTRFAEDFSLAPPRA